MSDDSVPAQSVPDGYSQTRFVTEEIDTTVDPATRTRVREALTDAVAGFRGALTDEQTAARLLTGDDTLREADTAHKEDPEPLTKRAFLDPLFEALGYDDLAVEVGDRSDSYGKKADYAASFDPFEEIDSGRLLIEAEPVNKRLRQDRHGLGQVEDWLSYRPFDATFGVATNGLQWTLVTYDADSYTLDTLADVDLRPVVQSVLTIKPAGTPRRRGGRRVTRSSCSTGSSPDSRSTTSSASPATPERRSGDGEPRSPTSSTTTTSGSCSDRRPPAGTPQSGV